MIDHFINKVKGLADAAASSVGVCRWGTVTSTRSTDTGYEVKLTLQPEGVLSGWLPVLSPMVGSNWGLVSPPGLGQQAFIATDLGNPNHAVVLGMGFSTQNMPPQVNLNGTQTPVKEGQFALVHKNGSYLYFDDNDVWLITSRDLNAQVGRNATVIAKNTAQISAPTINSDADGKGGNTTWHITGDVFVSGNVSDGHGSLDRLRQNYDQHRHTAVSGGTGTSGPTTNPDPE